MIIVGALAVFLGLLGVGLLIISPTTFTTAGSRRLRSMDEFVGLTTSEAVRKASANRITDQILGYSDKLIEGRESTRHSALLLERADLPLRVNEWYVVRVVVVFLAILAAWLFFSKSGIQLILALALGSVGGIFGPVLFLRIAASRRAKKFDTQLPDALTLMASSLSTGFSLTQSIDAIVRDASEPTAKEFARALAETRIGTELEDTLDRLAQRMGSRNLEWTTMAIRIQRQVGGNLAETLRTTATTIRDREALMRNVRSLSADGRLSGSILIGMPIALFFYMLKVSPDYVSLLWTSFFGLVMSGVGVILMVVGFFWMRKVVEVKV
jgi:tight adherence protein B